jgi:hypothetical protein
MKGFLFGCVMGGMVVGFFPQEKAFVMAHMSEAKSAATSAVDSTAKGATKAINQGASAAKEQLSK